jgi:hypothetical protein
LKSEACRDRAGRASAPLRAISATMSSIDQSRPLIPAAMAGVIRSVLCIRTKL